MSLKLVAQISCLGVFGSTAYATTIIDIDVPDNDRNQSSLTEISNTQKTKYSTTKPKETTFEDIEMFEKDKGCKLVFVEDFKKNKSYTPREWVNQAKQKHPKSWEKGIMDAVTYGLDSNRNRCKTKGQILVLEKNKYGNFDPKVWA